MLSIIPPAVATTVLIAAVLLTDPRREAAPGTAVVADNMQRHHAAARAAAPGAPGLFAAAIEPPFAPVVAWQSAVIADAGGALWLLSWPSGADAGARRVGPAAIAGLPAHWARSDPGTGFGRWEAVLPPPPGPALFVVDGITFPADAAVAIPAGAPVLASRL
jgi:hypothetical protein